MNRDIAEAQWKQLKGRLRQQWGKLTDEDLEQIKRRREARAGTIHQKYGVATEDPGREFDQLYHYTCLYHSTGDGLAVVVWGRQRPWPLLLQAGVPLSRSASIAHSLD